MCISMAYFSILVNGSPSGLSSSSRGLRQGDLLFSLLYKLVMEVLSRLLRREASLGVLRWALVHEMGCVSLISYLSMIQFSLAMQC